MNTTGKAGYWPIVQGLRPGLNDGEEPASFTSVEDLQARVLAFVEYFNTTMAKPFQWTYGQKPLYV